MITVYLETSALLAWLMNQSGGDDVRSRAGSARHIVTSSLTLAETERALVRAEVRRTLRAADVQKLMGQIHRLSQKWTEMYVTHEVLVRAGQRFPVEPVRTLDAIHLATALIFSRAIEDLQVLSLDRRIRDNAVALGLD
ncbi:MAG: type II toxin-antitoxin system VapC family toxin [Candidatus Polarisedimenticolia bacterium]